MQRLETMQQQAARPTHSAADSDACAQVPLDGMFFASDQFYENLHRAQGGRRAMAASDGEGNEAVAQLSIQQGEANARLSARSDRVSASDIEAGLSVADGAAAAALVGIGVGGRGVRVGSGLRDKRASQTDDPKRSGHARA